MPLPPPTSVGTIHDVEHARGSGPGGQPETSPFAALRQATNEVHRRLHRAIFLGRGEPEQPRLVLQGYLQLLDAFAALEAHELRAASMSPLTANVWRSGGRCTAAAADAELLRQSFRDVLPASPCGVTCLSSPHEIISCGSSALGFQYVLEGSTLGAPHIARQVSSLIGPEVPVGYLRSFEEPRIRWERFRAEAEPHLRNPRSMQNAVRTARATFREIEVMLAPRQPGAEHMEGESSGRSPGPRPEPQAVPGVPR